MRLNVFFRQNDSRLKVCFKDSANRLKICFKDVYRVNTIDEDMIYNGPYVVDPEQEVQTLPTAKKYLKKDVVVNDIKMGLATYAQINNLF